MPKDEQPGPPSAGVEMDVRNLAPPQPMIRILSALESMESGEHLMALLSRNPIHLLPLLEEERHTYALAQRDAETWELRITKG